MEVRDWWVVLEEVQCLGRKDTVALVNKWQKLQWEELQGSIDLMRSELR